MRRVFVMITLAALLFTSACRDDRITLAFHPAPGSEFVYAIHVESSTTTTLPTGRVTEPSTASDLTAQQRVLDANGDTTRVEVRLGGSGIGERTFVMRFDRAAQLTAVESVEGIPTRVLGSLGLSEIFPAAAGAPPDRRLRPGDSWTIDDRVQLAGMAAPSQLTGTGRLVQLSVVDGHDTATVSSSTTLPLTSTETTPDGVQTLSGVQTTTITVVYDLSNGSVRRSMAATMGSFALTLSPPAGQAGSPIQGALTVELRSDIERVRADQFAAAVDGVVPAPAPPATGASLPMITITFASLGSAIVEGTGVGNGCTAPAGNPSFAAIACASAS